MRALAAALNLALTLIAASASAEETRLLRDAEIFDLLADAEVRYEGARQVFHASGATDYHTDRASQGRWAARAGQYCSVRPPSDMWACYDVRVRTENGETWVIWIGSDRSRSEGRIVAKED